MATFRVPRLAPVTARDGVDTRTKEVTTRSGGDRGQDGSDAALEFDNWLWWPNVRLDLVAPAGAEVEGAPMWGAWGAYEQIALRRMEGSDESFRWVSYQSQIEQAEENLLALASEETQMEMFRLLEVNRAMTSLGYAIFCARRDLPTAPFLLDFHKTVVLSRMEDVTKAEAQLEEVHPEPPRCCECGWCDAMEDCDVCRECYERQNGGWGDGCDRGVCACGETEYVEGMCADCYWEEDARFKSEARAQRRLAHALPPPPIRIPLEPDDEPEVWAPRVY